MIPIYIYTYIYIYIYFQYPKQKYLTGGIPTPLKNDGVRQLGRISHILWKVIIQPCSKPPTRSSSINHQPFPNISNISMVKITMLSMGKSTISMVIFQFVFCMFTKLVTYPMIDPSHDSP